MATVPCSRSSAHGHSSAKHTLRTPLAVKQLREKSERLWLFKSRSQQGAPGAPRGYSLCVYCWLPSARKQFGAVFTPHPSTHTSSEHQIRHRQRETEGNTRVLLLQRLLLHTHQRLHCSKSAVAQILTCITTAHLTFTALSLRQRNLALRSLNTGCRMYVTGIAAHACTDENKRTRRFLKERWTRHCRHVAT